MFYLFNDHITAVAVPSFLLLESLCVCVGGGEASNYKVLRMLCVMCCVRIKGEVDA